jgi:peptide/nickel transport system substrate-binding protein
MLTLLLQACRMVAAACVMLAPAGATQAQELKLAVASAPTSADPHYSVLTPNVSLASHLFDALINRDPDSKPVPGLALSWSMVDDTTWEFRLRRNVVFHNGQ